MIDREKLESLPDRLGAEAAITHLSLVRALREEGAISEAEAAERAAPLEAYLDGGQKMEKEWEPYTGPRGGEGWRNTRTGEVRYQEERPTDGGGATLDDQPNTVTGTEEWEEFSLGDEQFLGHGDQITFERGDWGGRGEIQRITDNYVVVETPEGEETTIETWDIEQYQIEADELHDLRQTLREHAEDQGIGQHSKALEAYTNDSRYREFQDHLRGARKVAQESPFYDEHPRMETMSAILATADEEMARQIRTIQSYAGSSLPRELTVYRGVDVDAEEFLDRAEAAMERDERIMDEGFQSTSIDPEVAEGFGDVTLEVETDHGAYVRAASQHAGEDEVLLPAGTEYEVTGVDRDENTVHVVAHDGFDFNLDVDHVRELMETENISYAEAIQRVV